MNIYEHEKNGFHIIGPGDDVAAMEKAGWFKSTHPSERKPVPEISEVTEVKPRRGRPPKVKD